MADVQWCFSEIKGTVEEFFTEADIISCLSFNEDGSLLATGDKGGRVVVFQRNKCHKTKEGLKNVEYNCYKTFQSHEAEFDYLKSLDIEEKINKICWLKQFNPAHFLLTTNDKTIKLWKMSQRSKKLSSKSVISCLDSDNNTLLLPPFENMDTTVEAYQRKVYSNAHTYHINSISSSSDQVTFLSADDLRINLWNYEVTDQSFNIVDIKPPNMEDLTEVITAADFHPIDPSIFVYSSSKGSVRLCDLRSQALCDKYSKLYEEPEDPSNKSFFSEIISSISDVKFSQSGRYMLTRDYLSLKIWDLNMEKEPVESYSVHDYLRSKLCALYENDCIFDKFECSWGCGDRFIMTGSYNSFFKIFDRDSKKEVTLEASSDLSKPKQVLKHKRVCTGGKRKKDEISVDCLDFNKKVLHASWHPQDSLICLANSNNLFFFQTKE